MSLKKRLRKIAKFILSEDGKTVNISVSQVISGNVHFKKTFLITGGSKGIGFEIARKVISEGGKVVITGRNEANLVAAVKQLGEQADYIQFDSKKTNEMESLLLQVKSILGRVDHLVCNAGISNHDGDYSKVTEKSWDETFDTNLKSNFFLAKEFLSLKSKESETYGSIVFISSETGSQDYDIPYGLTKASLNSLTRALARRAIQNGIRVNAIAPGVTNTDMTNSYTDVEDGNYSFSSASGRLFLAEEVAEVTSFILSDAAMCISGEVIHTNMGNHLNPWWE